VAEEDFLGRLLKYIPAEIVGLYLAARGVIPLPRPHDDNDTILALWIVASACWIFVPVFFWFATTRNGNKPLLLQITLATIAFPVWVFAVGGPPVSLLPWYANHQYVGSILLMFTTFIFGMLKPLPGI